RTTAALRIIVISLANSLLLPRPRRANPRGRVFPGTTWPATTVRALAPVMVSFVEFQDVVRRRHMVRTFTGEPVPAETLERILANAVRGPSAGFSQGQAFLVLTGAELEKF